MKKVMLTIMISLLIVTGCTKKENVDNNKTTESISTTTTTTTEIVTEPTKKIDTTTTLKKQEPPTHITTKSSKTTKELPKLVITQKTTTKATCNLPSESEAYNIMMSRKSIYPDGTPWDMNAYFEWKGGVYISGKGSIAFAFLLSDAVFGGCSAKKVRNFNNIKVGDIVILNGERDSFIVLKVNTDSYTIAEGNYDGVVKWDRAISKSDVQSNADFVLTRW